MDNNRTFDDLFEELKTDDTISNQSVEIADRLARVIDSLSEARINQGVSQRQLAEKCGLKQSTIARIETLQNIPRLDTLIKIAFNLNLNIELYKSKPIEPDQIIYINNNNSWSYSTSSVLDPVVLCS